METFENIRQLRKQLGLTQQELALKVGYTDRSTIAKIESGAVDLSQSKIATFAAVLGVTPAQLMGIEEEKPIAIESDELLRQTDEVKELLKKIAPEQRESVLQMLRTFAAGK
nr:MAG TPA: helix-turn-helix domain protein [Caudoviricetes sp.]